MTGRTALLIAIVVLAGTAGEMFLSHAMKRIGEVPRFSPGTALAIFGRAMKLRSIWIGVGLMAVGFFSFLALLSREAVSFAVPVTASSYAVGALGAKFLLGEEVRPMRWAGVLLVCAGVALTCLE